MKFTRSWLETHLEPDQGVTLETIADTLSAIGLEVEKITDRAAPLAPFRTARILGAVPHPNADRLRVCDVDIGTGTTVQVVCGAPNARAGLATVFAPPGAVIPATGQTLKVGEIRGVASNGMLCSLRELGQGEDHEGIAALPDDTAPGLAYATFAGLDDPIVEIAVTPNRGDALAIRGIARDLAAAGLGQLKPLRPAAIEPRGHASIQWAIEDQASCPWVVGRTIRNMRNGPSPDWLRRRLEAVGQRSISALVDVTNFFTLDLGRPLHVFDADKLAGSTLTLRPARPAEPFTALGDQPLDLEAGDLVIADERGIQSLAGIKGGQHSAATSETRNVFVECALFDPIRIATTGRRLNLASDARQRFERGIDPSALPAMLDAATHMILELCGGEPSAVTRAGAEPPWQREATLHFDRIGTLGGLDLHPDEAAARLEALGFTPTDRDPEKITVQVPPWRNDIASRLPVEPMPGTADIDPVLARRAEQAETEADLVEEVLRLGGLDAVPPVSLPQTIPVPRPSLPAPAIREATLRRALAARSYLECVSFSFLDGAYAEKLAPPATDADRAALTLLNPISSDLDRLRPTPLASLLQAASRNAARGEPDQALFEIGPAFAATGARTVAAALRTGQTPRHHATPARPVSWQTARADALAMLELIGVPMDALATEPVPEDDPVWHPGRSGRIKQGPKTVLATFGELHPLAREAANLDIPAVAFELDLDRIALPKRRRRTAPHLSPLQPVRRDFAFVVKRDTRAEALIRAAKGADRTLITAVTLFDTYTGAPLANDEKSVAIEVTIQPKDATLTDAEIEALSATIVTTVARLTGATLR